MNANEPPTKSTTPRTIAIALSVAAGHGWCFLVYGVGAVVGLVAVFRMNRELRPADADGWFPSGSMSWPS